METTPPQIAYTVTEPDNDEGHDRSEHAAGSVVNAEINKSYSFTNLSAADTLKRPPLDGRSRSSVSMKHIITTPKTPVRTPKKQAVKSPRVDTNKTLVDQFFTINKEATTPINISQRRFNSRTSLPAAVEDPLDEDFPINELVYDPVDEFMVNDPELTNYLLNIDTVTRDLFQQNPETSSLTPLNNTLQALVQTIQQRAKQYIVTPSPSTLADLHTMLRHLRVLNAAVAKFCEELVENHGKVRNNYRVQINKNVEKLNDLLFTLDKLETRFGRTRDRIRDNKQIISDSVLQRIEVLEYVESKFAEFSRENRKRRFKQLNITLGVLVLLSSIYFGIYGFK